MKKTILATMIVVVSAVAYGQGAFNFSNFSGPVDAPVTKGTNGLVDSTSYMAAIAWGAGVVTDANSLTVIPAENTAFFGSGFPGYFFGNNIQLGSSFSGTATVQVRYWNTAAPGGASFAGAQVTPLGEWGQSGLFQLNIGASAQSPPIDMVGLGAVTMVITQIPEPSTFALAGLGLASMLMLRRRK